MAASKAGLFKFPRTKYLFDAGGGGVSRDDLLMDAGEEKKFYSQPGRGQQQLVTIEEKVDGANLGISIDADMNLCVQNRSHFINSKTHKQFSSLDVWLSNNSPSLFEILTPGQQVLFGEWLYAKHSIHYTRLPGYFMAFDIYDRVAGKFLSWRERNRRLEGSGIPIVKQIAEIPLSGREEVRKWLDTPSAFYDGPCEGIYLRIDEDMPRQGGGERRGGRERGGRGGEENKESLPYCKWRSKLVRPDFLQGIEEQWTRQQLKKNIVVYEY